MSVNDYKMDIEVLQNKTNQLKQNIVNIQNLPLKDRLESYGSNWNKYEEINLLKMPNMKDIPSLKFDCSILSDLQSLAVDLSNHTSGRMFHTNVHNSDGKFYYKKTYQDNTKGGNQHKGSMATVVKDKSLGRSTYAKNYPKNPNSMKKSEQKPKNFENQLKNTGERLSHNDNTKKRVTDRYNTNKDDYHYSSNNNKTSLVNQNHLNEFDFSRKKNHDYANHNYAKDIETYNTFTQRRNLKRNRADIPVSMDENLLVIGDSINDITTSKLCQQNILNPQFFKTTLYTDTDQNRNSSKNGQNFNTNLKRKVYKERD